MIILWKELRGILPLWLGVLAAIWLPELLGLRPFGLDLNAWLVFSTVIGGACLATAVYAREFHDRTMLWQLVQPVDRLSILGRKVGVLLFALAPVFASVVALQAAGWSASREGWLVLGSLLAIGLTSGCFWSILTGNLLATAVMTVAAPILLALVASPLIERLQRTLGVSEDTLVMGVLYSYAAITGISAVFLWRRLQLRGEAVAVSGLDIRWFSRMASDDAYRIRPAWAALLLKELGVLRFVFWMVIAATAAAGIFFVADQWFTHVANERIAGGFGGVDPDRGPLVWQEGLHIIGTMAMVFYLALIPALSGSLAFAEESYFGTRLFQLCQPTPLGRQWAIKASVACLASVLAGLALPAVVFQPLIRLAGGSIDSDAVSQTISIHFLLFGASAWCASGSRATVAALLKALLFVAGFLMLHAAIAEWFHFRWFNWQIMAWPTAVLALAFTFPNFKALDLPLRSWSFQLAAITAFGSATGFLAGLLMKLGILSA